MNVVAPITMRRPRVSDWTHRSEVSKALLAFRMWLEMLRGLIFPALRRYSLIGLRKFAVRPRAGIAANAPEWLHNRSRTAPKGPAGSVEIEKIPVHFPDRRECAKLWSGRRPAPVIRLAHPATDERDGGNG